MKISGVLATAVVTVLVTGLATSCGSGSGSEPSHRAATPPATRSASPSPADATPVGAEADGRLRAAVGALARKDSGRYVHTLSAGSRQMVRLVGDYQLSSARSALDITTRDPQGATARLRSRAIGRRLFVTSLSWPGATRGCWWKDPPNVFDSLTGTPQDTGDRVPAALGLLDSAAATGTDPSHRDVVVGTLDLGPAFRLVAPAAATKLSSDALTGTTAARFTVRDGALASVDVRGDDVMRSLDEAGQSLTDADRMTFSVIEAHVDYVHPGRGVTVKPPASSLVMTTEQAQSGAGCRG